MAAEGSAEHPVEIIDSEDDEKMDISEPPRRLEEPEIIDLRSDDDASEAACTDEDDEAGGALETDQPLKKADEVEDEQPQISVLRTQHLEYLGDKTAAARATYAELHAASDIRLKEDGYQSIPLHVRNRDLPEFQPLYDPSEEELDRFAKLLPVLFPYVKLYKYGGAYADRAQGRSRCNHYSDQYFYQSRKGGSPGPLVLAWGYKDNESALKAEQLLIDQPNNVNKNNAGLPRVTYTEARPGAVYAVSVLREIDGVAIDTKEDFLGVHESPHMKKKKNKGLSEKFIGAHGYSALLDCLFNSGLGHKQLREMLMKKSHSGLNRLCKAAKGDVLAKLKAGNHQFAQGKRFMNDDPFKKLQAAYMVSAYKK
jgi:hypothetical protein